MLRVITKKMKADYGLPIDPCADVEDVSTKGHRTFTFEQPNSLGVDELSTFFEIAWEKYPQRDETGPRWTAAVDSTKEPAEPIHDRACFPAYSVGAIGIEPTTPTVSR